MISFGLIFILAVVIFSGYLPIGKQNQPQEVSSLSGEVLIWGILPPVIVSPAFRKLEEETDNQLKISYEQKTVYDLENDYTEALVRGNAPDLLIFSNLQLLTLGDKLYHIPYASMPRAQFEVDYVDAAQVFLGPYGVIGLPFAQDPLVMYYNKDILAKHFMFEPPKFWDEYFDFGEQVTEREGPIVNTSAIAFGGFTNINNAADILAMLFLQLKNPIAVPYGAGYGVTLEQDFINFRNSSKSALEFYLSFSDAQNKHYSWNQSKESSLGEFLAGRLAVYFGYASESSTFLQSNPNLNVGVAGVPQWRDVSTISFARLYAFGINGRSPNLETAFEVMWNLSGRRYGTFLGQSFGMQPVFKNQLGVDPSAPNYQKVFSESAYVARSWPDPNPGATFFIFRDMVQGVISGVVDSERAIERAAREIQKLY